MAQTVLRVGFPLLQTISFVGIIYGLTDYFRTRRIASLAGSALSIFSLWLLTRPELWIIFLLQDLPEATKTALAGWLYRGSVKSIIPYALLTALPWAFYYRRRGDRKAESGTSSRTKKKRA